VWRGRIAAGIVAWAMMSACGGSEQKPASSASVPVESTMGATPPATGGVTAGVAAVPRVLIIGTSLTAGLGLDPDSAYPAALQRLADSAGVRVRIVGAGLSGETSAGALRRTEWLLRDRADLVVIETGANDGLRGLDPDSTKANLVAIIAKVRRANPQVVVLLAQMEAPKNLGVAYTTAFRRVFTAVGTEQGVGVIPFFLEGVAGVPAMNQEDGIHPTEAGARKAARNMWRTLRPAIEGLASPQS
jgi:acyl-CoA thioesterase-1